MAAERKHMNGNTQSDHDQSISPKKSHPLYQLLKRACAYSKEHPLMALSILGAIASEGYFQAYTKDQVGVGIDKSNVILAKRFNTNPLDLNYLPLFITKEF